MPKLTCRCLRCVPNCCPLQKEYGRRWGDLERQEGVGRDTISTVCSMLVTIHLKKASGATSAPASVSPTFTRRHAHHQSEGCSRRVH